MAEKFEEKAPEGFEQKGSGLYVPKEERGHIRSEEEVERARELIPEEEKIESAEEREERKEREWKFGTRTLERIKKMTEESDEEKKAMESAKIPEKGMGTDEILKEVGIEKPAESLKEIEDRLKDELKGVRVRGGEKPSEAEEIERTRDFYLKELGYSLEYKGLLRGKARLLDAEGKHITDEKDEPREFKAFFRMKKEKTPLIDFLKEELKSKFEKKSEKAPAGKTKEEKLEAGFQKTVKTAEQEQERREEKISSLQDVKKVGKERLEKLKDGLAYVAALDKLSILGLREGKKLAIEGGKDLAATGLTPAAAVEEASRYISGIIHRGEARRKEIIAMADAQLSAEGKEALESRTKRATEEYKKGYDLIYKKGRILRLIGMMGGKLSRPVGRTFGPPPPSRPERI